MEGLPLVLIEAMCLGKPVIAPNVAGIPELVVEGATGLLFRAGDWDQLGQKMIKMATDPALRGVLERNVRLRALPEFHIDTAVQPLMALFDQPPTR
jgi:glycosyltransferase involved in cell wall biosynthesis